MPQHVNSPWKVKCSNQREAKDVFAMLQLFLLREKSQNRKRPVRIIETMYSVSHEVSANDFKIIRKGTCDRLGMSPRQLRKDLCKLRKAFFEFLCNHMPEYKRYIDRNEH